jgi:hypothetical protein
MGFLGLVPAHDHSENWNAPFATQQHVAADDRAGSIAIIPRVYTEATAHPAPDGFPAEPA